MSDKAKQTVVKKRTPTFNEALSHIYTWHTGRYNSNAGWTLEQALKVVGDNLRHSVITTVPKTEMDSVIKSAESTIESAQQFLSKK